MYLLLVFMCFLMLFLLFVCFLMVLRSVSSHMMVHPWAKTMDFVWIFNEYEEISVKYVFFWRKIDFTQQVWVQITTYAILLSHGDISRYLYTNIFLFLLILWGFSTPFFWIWTYFWAIYVWFEYHNYIWLERYRRLYNARKLVKKY